MMYIYTLYIYTTSTELFDPVLSSSCYRLVVHVGDHPGVNPGVLLEAWSKPFEADSWDGLVMIATARMPSTEIGAGRPSLPLSYADVFLVHDAGGCNLPSECAA